jgi:hypothetical protein
MTNKPLPDFDFVADIHGTDYYTPVNLMLALAEGHMIDAIRILRRIANNLELEEATDLVRAVIAGKPKYYDSAVYAVIAADDLCLRHYNSIDAENDATGRSTVDGPYYVVQAISKVEVTVQVTPCT